MRRGEGAKTSRCTQNEQGCILPLCLCNTRTMPALPQTNQQLEVASKITRSSSSNSAVEEGARKQGLTCQKTRRQATGRRGGSAPPRLGRAGGADTAQHSTASARSCRILPACLGPSPAPVGIATTPCLQPAPASQNNLCMVSAHEDITVPLKEHCIASSLVCEVSESWPFSVDIALGTALTAP